MNEQDNIIKQEDFNKNSTLKEAGNDTTETITGLELLKILKRKRALSCSDIGSAMGGLDKSYISRILTGIWIPNRKLKEKLADFFNVPVDVIWSDVNYSNYKIEKGGSENGAIS